jgi:hypothetical protein
MESVLRAAPVTSPPTYAQSVRRGQRPDVFEEPHRRSLGNGDARGEKVDGRSNQAYRVFAASQLSLDIILLATWRRTVPTGLVTLSPEDTL